MQSLAIVIPVFNEAEVIENHINDLLATFDTYDLKLYVIDDASQDDTSMILRKFDRNEKVKCFRNSQNLGHGPTVLYGLNLCSSNEQFIVTVDGDGNYMQKDLKKVVDALVKNSNYIEGVRFNRSDPWFRRLISAFTNLIVLAKTGKKSSDANTPIRGYTQNIVKQLVQEIDQNNLVPNLAISILARRNKLEIKEINVQNIDRIRISNLGTTWRIRNRNMPSWRLLKFCVKSFFAIVFI